MKISYNWLKEYVDVKNSAAAVAQWLTMAGLEVKGIEEKGRDSILELEITSNRPDWLSLVGIAREVSAITGKHLKVPKVPLLVPVLAREKDIKVDVEDKTLCPRYTGRIIDLVQVEPSPKFLKEHLESIGVRSVNNVVDITNFCLFELGQPLHAFDYDKLAGRRIIVRRAKKGEKITTIDKIDRVLDPETLVIADEQKPVAIAGVMGGLDTEVTSATRTVLLESASFDPISVRSTARRLSLSTDSSYRFERGVDPEGVLFTSTRAARMIEEFAGARMGIIRDVGLKAAKGVSIRLSVDKLNSLLNTDLAPVAVKKILEGLDFKIAAAQKEMKVDIPSFRRDVRREEDLVEEVARLNGYDKIPVTIPRLVGHTQRKEPRRVISETAKEILLGAGFDEIVTFSMISRDDLKKISPAASDVVLIKNPLSSQQEALRRSLIPGMLAAARFNINRKAESLSLFELSSVYRKAAGKEYKEELNLCMLMSGKAREGWRLSADADFFEIKGVAQTLFTALGLVPAYREIVAQDAAPFCPGRVAAIALGDTIVGTIGEVQRDVLESFDIKKKIFLCDINFEKLLRVADQGKRFAPLAKFLPVARDISIVAEKKIRVADLAVAMKEAGGALAKAVTLCDEYAGQQIPAGKRGLTFSVEYLDEEKQLTEEEIEKAHGSIRQALIEKFGVALR